MKSTLAISVVIVFVPLYSLLVLAQRERNEWGNQTADAADLYRTAKNDRAANVAGTALEVAERDESTDHPKTTTKEFAPGTSHLNVNSRNHFGQTKLALAAVEGNEKLVQELLKQGADPNIPDHYGITPLGYTLAGPYISHAVAENLQDEAKETRTGRMHFLSVLSRKEPSFAKYAMTQLVFGQTDDSSALLEFNTSVETAERTHRILERLLNAGADPNQTDAAGYGPLHVAAGTGDSTSVTMLLENHSTVNLQSVIGNSPLFTAVYMNRLRVVDLLLRAGADPNLVGNTLWSPLHKAAQNGEFAIVQVLIQHGAYVSARDNAGFTPLHTAAERGHAEILRLLLKNGATPDTVTPDGYTPVNSAAFLGKTEILKVLLEAGANVNPNTTGGVRPPLSDASGYAHSKAVKLLLEFGADIHAVDSTRNTALHSAVADPVWMEKAIDQLGIRDVGEWGNWPAERGSDTDRLKVVQSLLEAGADVHARNSYNNTPLNFLAINWGSPKAADLLLQYGAEVDSKGLNGATPLLNTTEKGFTELAAFFIENGADVTVKAKDTGATTLHLAVNSGYLDLVELLVKHNAPLHDLDIGKQTPAMLCLIKGRSDMLEIMYRKDPSVLEYATQDLQTMLHIAAASGHAEMVRFLLDKGFDPEALNRAGETPIFGAAAGMTIERAFDMENQAAAMLGLPVPDYDEVAESYQFGDEYAEIAEMLIEAGANVNRQSESTGISPLFYACNSGLIEVVKVLLDHGADFLTLNPRHKYLPVHAAADYGNTEIVKIFLDSGVNVDVLASHGAPLHFASVSVLSLPRKNLKTVDLLVERGADVNLYGSYAWRTPLHSAIQSKNYYVAERLIFHGANFSRPDLNSSQTIYDLARKSFNKPLVAVMSARLNFSLVQGFHSAIGNEQNIVAVVESEAITTSDVIAYGRGPNAFFGHYPMERLEDPEEISQIMGEVETRLKATATELIGTRLMAWACEMAGMEVKELRLKEAKEDLAERLGISTFDLPRSLRPFDWTPDDFARIAQWSAAARIMEEKYIDPGVSVTQQDIRAHYEATKMADLSPTRIRLQIITLTNRAVVSTLLDELEAGTEFAALAKRYSTNSTARRGGDLGWALLSDVRKDFLDSFSEIKDGTVGCPVALKDETVILRISDVEEPAPQPFDEVRSDIQKFLIDQAGKDTREHILSLLADAATVESYIDLPW
jgi:ankyrin repeat protein